jgi:hypothetical protein
MWFVNFFDEDLSLHLKKKFWALTPSGSGFNSSDLFPSTIEKVWRIERNSINFPGG